MDDIEERIRQLLRKNTWTISEKQELQSLVGKNFKDIDKLTTILQEYFDNDPEQGVQSLNSDRSEILLAHIHNRIGASSVGSVHRVHFLRTAWFRYAAAILIVFGSAAYLWNKTRGGKEMPITTVNSQLQSDVPPGGEKAILTLADGSKINLENAANGNLAQQGNAKIVKLSDGRIVYHLQGKPGKEVMWNTISTPPGGQYQVIIPDGTKVWLNAASSITYPTGFVEKHRRVKISGELYLEVVKDNEKPFVVDVDGRSLIEVLGTSFNINSYSDEENIKTTLVEGSVKIIKGKKEAILKPGYQAVVQSSIQQPESGNDEIKIQPADLNQVLAWKNGTFNFNGADLFVVMRQLERWYGIKVRYQGSVSNVIFGGEMYRNANLSDVLEALRKMGVKFKLEGKTLIVGE